MADRPFIAPLDTFSATELETYGDALDALAPNVLDVLVGYGTARYIQNLALMYSLNEEQQRGVARFLAEAILNGSVATSQTGPELSRIAGVDANTATQIVKELEAGLLSPLGLTLSGLATPASEPAVVVDEKGREELRYASVDDLLADIADLNPDQREKFLQDAKRDNRVIVLQALSQLKLGADGSGRPLSFRRLVADEAANFTVRDWTDLARNDADALAEPDILGHIADTPLGAMLQGRDPAAARTIVLQFRELDEASREILAGQASAAAIGQLVRPGLVPPTHAAAVGRTVFFVVTGQARLENVPDLLKKVGLNAAAADAATRTIAALTGQSVPTEAPQAPAPVAPVQRTPGLNVPNAGSRTILDLRNPRP